MRRLLDGAELDIIKGWGSGIQPFGITFNGVLLEVHRSAQLHDLNPRSGGTIRSLWIPGEISWIPDKPFDRDAEAFWGISVVCMA